MRWPDLAGPGERKFRLAFGSLVAGRVGCFRGKGNREVPYDVVAAPAAVHEPGSVVAGV